MSDPYRNRPQHLPAGSDGAYMYPKIAGESPGDSDMEFEPLPTLTIDTSTKKILKNKYDIADDWRLHRTTDRLRVGKLTRKAMTSAFLAAPHTGHSSLSHKKRGSR